VTWTHAGVAELLVELGMLTERQARERAQGEGLDHVPLDDDDLPAALVDLGVAVSVHGGDVADPESGYRALLTGAARCSDGAVVVGGVRLDGAELRFVRNGVPQSWHVERESAECLDHLAVYEFIHLLAPDDERTFHGLPQRESGEAGYYVLATTGQARALADATGLVFD
jgi:hypothetical protein